MAKQQPKAAGRTKGEFVPPVNLMKLVKQIGPGKAHDLLGISTTMIHKARRENSVSRVVEVAAAALLKTMDHKDSHLAAPAPKAHYAVDATLVMVLLSVPQSKLAIVQKFAESLGAEYTVAA